MNATLVYGIAGIQEIKGGYTLSTTSRTAAKMFGIKHRTRNKAVKIELIPIQEYHQGLIHTLI